MGNDQRDRRRARFSASRVRQILSGARWLLLCIVLPLLAACADDTHLTFLNPQGPIADAQRWHFYEVLGVMAVLVAGPIFLLLPFFAWRYRYREHGAKYTPRWEYSKLLEIMSWGGPIVIVIILAFFVWRDTHRLDPYRPLASTQAPLRVQVIGYDWKWLFIYPDQGIASIGTLAMPVGAADLGDRDAIVFHSRTGQPDLRDGGHGLATESRSQPAGTFVGREHDV